MNEKFLKTTDNIKIAINHYNKNRKDVIIICPGWFMTKDSKAFKNLSKDLSQYFDIISMDFRGHGKSQGFYTFTAKEENDVNTVINFAKEKCHYEQIYLMGFSLGGALAIICAAKNKYINKVISISAPTEFSKIENHMYSPDAWIPTLFQKFEPKRWLTIRPSIIIHKKEKPINLVEKIEVPTLFIAGEKDPTVFPWHTETLYKKAHCPKEYLLLKNARHAEDLYLDYPEIFLKNCIEWLK